MKPLSSPTFIGLKLYPLDPADNQEEKFKKNKKNCSELYKFNGRAFGGRLFASTLRQLYFMAVGYTKLYLTRDQE